MKKLSLLFTVCCLLFVSACDMSRPVHDIQCGSFAMKVRVYNGHLRVTLNDKRVKFTQVPAASGAKYAGEYGSERLILWAKGDNWMLIVGDSRIFSCAGTGD